MAKKIDTEAFKAEVEALCRKYGVILAPDRYDTIQVWRKSHHDEWVRWDDEWDCVSEQAER